MIRKILLPFVAMGTLFAVSACNTVQGVGEDIESVGETGEAAMD